MEKKYSEVGTMLVKKYYLDRVCLGDNYVKEMISKLFLSGKSFLS